MEYWSKNISINLKRIRKSKNMSLDMVAEQTGVSKSMLAQIERGEANPTIGILGRIVSGLRVDFNSLIESPSVDTYLVEKEKLLPDKQINGEYKLYTCFPYDKDRGFEIDSVEIEPGGTYISFPHGEKSNEYLYVSKGAVSLEVEDQCYEIPEENMIRFDCNRKHILKNPTEGTAYAVIFLTY